MIQTPSLKLTEAIKLASSRLTDLSGRSRRSEFWWWVLVMIVANIIVSLPFPAESVASNIISLIFTLLMVSVTVRRLHDAGKSGWWLGINIIVMLATWAYVQFSDFGQTLTQMSQNDFISERQIENFFSEYGTNTTILVLLGLAILITSAIVFVMCLIDSKPMDNKYGPSIKYIEG